jgi:NADH pyrophosphatase NudC (nudix superfamily)
VNFVLIAAALTLAVVLYTLFVRSQDLPEAAPVNPFHHLEARKATIYENLRDLQFEYRVGKLSDEDYQRTKKDMQAELAAVLSELDRAQQQGPVSDAVATKGKGDTAKICPHCGAKFEKALKFCGECGKAMVVQSA